MAFPLRKHLSGSFPKPDSVIPKTRTRSHRTKPMQTHALFNESLMQVTKILANGPLDLDLGLENPPQKSRAALSCLRESWCVFSDRPFRGWRKRKPLENPGSFRGPAMFRHNWAGNLETPRQGDGLQVAHRCSGSETARSGPSRRLPAFGERVDLLYLSNTVLFGGFCKKVGQLHKIGFRFLFYEGH